MVEGFFDVVEVVKLLLYVIEEVWIVMLVQCVELFFF